MSEDKELVDAWICEFWSLVERSPDSIKNSEFNQIRLEGFLMAKRSQQSVVLPKIETPEGYYDYTEVFAALTAAGIKYTVSKD